MSHGRSVKSILLVEDNSDDVFLMRRVLRKAAITIPVGVVTDGKQAISYLEGTGIYGNRQKFPLPDLIFLDLKLPFYDGFVVLAWIRKQAALTAIRVIILTSSMEDQDCDKAEALGSPYLIKPPTQEMVVDTIVSFECGLNDPV